MTEEESPISIVSLNPAKLHLYSEIKWDNIDMCKLPRMFLIHSKTQGKTATLLRRVKSWVKPALNLLRKLSRLFKVVKRQGSSLDVSFGEASCQYISETKSISGLSPITLSLSCCSFDMPLSSRASALQAAAAFRRDKCWHTQECQPVAE